MLTKMTWSYGLLEEEVEIDGKREKVLILSEIYFDKKRESKGACYLNWKDIKESIAEEDTTTKIIAKDINSQIKNKYFFKVNKNKIIL